ncbi:MAG: hypothetical protein IKK47_01530 [Ruminococcus sp.]|nr:hypothetical protein [Ruminococcus sp.]
MKKISALLFALTLLFLTGCSAEQSKEKSSKDTKVSHEESGDSQDNKKKDDEEKDSTDSATSSEENYIEAGTMISKGTVIKVKSKGKEEAQIPDFADCTVSEYKNRLEKAGISDFNYQFIASNGYYGKPNSIIELQVQGKKIYPGDIFSNKEGKKLTVYYIPEDGEMPSTSAVSQTTSAVATTEPVSTSATTTVPVETTTAVPVVTVPPTEAPTLPPATDPPATLPPIPPATDPPAPLPTEEYIPPVPVTDPPDDPQYGW